MSHLQKEWMIWKLFRSQQSILKENFVLSNKFHRILGTEQEQIGFKLISKSETLAVGIMTVIPKGCQAMPFFNVFLESIIYVGFH